MDGSTYARVLRASAHCRHLSPDAVAVGDRQRPLRRPKSAEASCLKAAAPQARGGYACKTQRVLPLQPLKQGPPRPQSAFRVCRPCWSLDLVQVGGAQRPAAKSVPLPFRLLAGVDVEPALGSYHFRAPLGGEEASRASNESSTYEAVAAAEFNGVMDAAEAYRHRGSRAVAKKPPSQRAQVNQVVLKQVDAFDKRWLHQNHSYVGHRLSALDSSGRPRSNNRRVICLDGESPTMVECSYEIFGASSEMPPHSAVNLTMDAGKKWRWSTKAGCVKNQNVIVEVSSPFDSVCAIELSLPDELTSPKHCRMQYCATSGEGPWLDAWSFECNGSKGVFKAAHDFGGCARLFRDYFVERCGGVENARGLLSSVGGGRYISVRELRKLVHRFCMTPGEIWRDFDEKRLVREVDSTKSGFVEIEEFLSDAGPAPPMARWWRLFIVDNGGSPDAIVIGAPMRLWVQARRRSDVAASVARPEPPVRAAVDVAVVEPATKIVEDTSHITRCAKANGVSLSDVKQIYDLFLEHKTSANLVVGKDEFNIVVSELLDRPLSSLELDISWKQCDLHGSGEVKVDEFVLWYSLYFDSL